MAARAGPGNSITDVPGILVGQAEDHAGISGTTVVLAEAPAAASVDVRGGAPGSRETELLAPGTLVNRIDAIVLSGGSAFGLDAAAGVMDGLLEMGRGFTVGSALVPIVPAAILFDLGFPNRRAWIGEPPYRALGRRAVAAAAKDFALGNTGAGLGPPAGRLKAGIGGASLVLFSWEYRRNRPRSARPVPLLVGLAALAAILVSGAELASVLSGRGLHAEELLHRITGLLHVEGPLHRITAYLRIDCR